LFDWLHDVTKGEDPLKPRLIKIAIAILVIYILFSIWGCFN